MITSWTVVCERPIESAIPNHLLSLVKYMRIHSGQVFHSMEDIGCLAVFERINDFPLLSFSFLTISGRGEPALVLEDVAKVAMPFVVIRLDLQRPSIAGFGFREPVLLLEGDAQVAMPNVGLFDADIDRVGQCKFALFRLLRLEIGLEFVY